ncbi:MAG: class I SAM-dependent methyltransferase [Hyphomonas sp.]
MIKSKFDNLYDLPRPAPYAQEMRSLHYRDPDYLPVARRAFDRFVSDVTRSRAAPLIVLDVCAGYGINSLTLRFGLESGDAYAWLASGQATPTPIHSTRWLPPDAHIIGIDIAHNALAYAQGAGLIDGFICRDLETDKLLAQEAQRIAKSDILISTGSLSYITERTIGQILSAIDAESPLLALFWPLLGVDTQKLTTCMRASGLTVSHDQTPIWQRNYKSNEERERYYAWYRDRNIRIEGTLAETGLCATHLCALRS